MGPVLVYPQFIGRLGNNLFQIAAAIGYAKKYNCGWGIQKGYIEPGFQVYQVDQFMPWLPENEGNHFRRWNEPSFDYHEIPHNPQGVRIVGFFQSLKYFSHCQDEVKKWIKLPRVDRWEGHCGIHARRGDYVDLETNFPTVTLEYFKQAIPIMVDKGFTKFFVCSDGIEWCEDILPPAFPDLHFEFSKGRNEWQDLSVYGSCGANIIANSSFSWWGAFLNQTINKTVVSPHNTSWFGPDGGPVREALAAGKEPCADLIPDEWIKIKFR